MQTSKMVASFLYMIAIQPAFRAGRIPSDEFDQMSYSQQVPVKDFILYIIMKRK